MACSLFGSKPLPEPILNYYQLEPQQQNLNLNQNVEIFFQEGAFENVIFKISTILFRGNWHQ